LNVGGQVRTEQVGAVRTLTIDRPEVKNALTRAMRDDLCERLAAADADDGVRAVVLTAVDPVFSAGVDFKEIAAGGTAASTTNPGEALRSMRTPVICAVNGPCVSGALEIALSCSFVIASTRARFADTHARLGVMATWGLTALLPRAVGIRRATEMSITGNFVDADDALRIGLVNHVVDHEDLLPSACALAGDVAAGEAARAVARLYRDGEGDTTVDALHREQDTAARVNAAFRAEEFGAAGQATARRERARGASAPAAPVTQA
jgi:enoyl-CoA hydratase